MKCLSLWQPWATLIIIGAKKFETRSWDITHRGLLGIHAAKKRSREQIELCVREPFRSALFAAGYMGFDDLPLGCMLGTVDVQICFLGRDAMRLGLIKEPEDSFGDYTPGRFCASLKNVQRYGAPIPAKGMQGLFNWHKREAPR